MKTDGQTDSNLTAIPCVYIRSRPVENEKANEKDKKNTKK